eukprot:TRINITY_DN3991_c0_g1_i5.p1 TRINITY_DN3991_c0_g1~~TRINITY_DN3991_c0_g1_i5.p1  ORF type:complete len:144 (+),score=13.33 TRINITY_DN3991_c0_g1_i5:147-578(+)
MDTVPTLGLNMETLRYNNLELLVFDVAGQVSSLWSHYYDNVDAVIFVVDSTDKERITKVRSELANLVKTLAGKDYVLMVYFNKQDKPERMDDFLLLEETGVSSITATDVIVQKCSARDNTGIFDGLEKLSRYLSRRRPSKDKA